MAERKTASHVVPTLGLNNDDLGLRTRQGDSCRKTATPALVRANVEGTRNVIAAVQRAGVVRRKIPGWTPGLNNFVDVRDVALHFPRRPDPLRFWRRAAPDRVALVDRARGGRWTYADLDAAADRWPRWKSAR